MRWIINNFDVELLLIELLFCFRLSKRRNFPLRLFISIPLYFIISWLLKQVSLPGDLRLLWMIIRFLITVAASCLLLWMVFRMTFKQLVFYCCVSQTFQHMVHCTARIFRILFKLEGHAAEFIEAVLLVLAIFLCYRFVLDRFKSSETADIKSTHVLVFAVVSTLTVYFISVLTTWIEGETAGEQFFDLFSCILILLILFDIFKLSRSEKEQFVMLRLLRQEQQQHELSKATIEVINRKCHDLKHQITALSNMPKEQQKKSISELEHDVLIYDSFAKTGNSDLDIIIAEKSLLAEKQSIVLQCIADGQKLDFMKPEDLYSLMGNALDNAIEAAAKEREKEKRVIEMNVFQKEGFVYISLTNPCEKEPVFADELPVTTKEDTDYHGYGMKSIRYIAEKYHGAAVVGWDEGIFSLNIIIPCA